MTQGMSLHWLKLFLSKSNPKPFPIITKVALNEYVFLSNGQRGFALVHELWPQGSCPGEGLEVKI